MELSDFFRTLGWNDRQSALVSVKGDQKRTFMEMNLRRRYWVIIETIISWPVSVSLSRRGRRRAWVWMRRDAASKSDWSGDAQRSGGVFTPRALSMSEESGSDIWVDLSVKGLPRKDSNRKVSTSVTAVAKLEVW